MFELNQLQAHRGDDQGAWTRYLRTSLLEGANGYCLHETLQHYNDQPRAILEWVHDVGRTMTQLPGTDIVHFDFHHRNLLRQADRITGVVDWEGVRLGDCLFDLVTFCFGFTHAVTEPGLEEMVWNRITTTSEPNVIESYVAHTSLRRLDWTIHHQSEEVERVTDFVLRYQSK